MSLLPPKILKIMEWIGFSGDGADAIEKLNDCADSGTLRSSIAMMTPFTYYFIFEFQFGAVGVKNGLDISKVRAAACAFDWFRSISYVYVQIGTALLW